VLVTNVTPPSISGTPVEGSTLTATPGDWSGADSVVGQWEYSPDNNLTTWLPVTGKQNSGNLVTNPSFEVDLTGYSAGGGGSTITRVTSTSKFGIASMEIVVVVGGGTNAGCTAPLIAGLTPGETYTMSYYAKAKAGSGGVKVDCQVNAHNSTTGFLTYEHGGEITLSETEWRRSSFSFVMPPTGDQGYLFLTLGDTQEAIDAGWYVDGVEFQKGQPLDLSVPYETTGFYARYTENAFKDGVVVEQAFSNIVGPITTGPPPKWVPLEAKGVIPPTDPKWVVVEPIDVPQATGGTITQDSTHIYHTFLANGNFQPLVPIPAADILVVAGGGGGGGIICGGGGAGGVLAESAAFAPDIYPVVVGIGGQGGTGFSSATEGGNQGGYSQIVGITVPVQGGGGGAGFSTAASPADIGGSGGGGSSADTGATANRTGAAGTPGQGNNGGSVADVPTANAGAGGGGAGQPGQSTDANTTANGGDGIQWFNGSYYGGGGGGGTRDASGPAPGAGGLGGGGAGSRNNTKATDGTANTGGGGGGGGYASNNPTGIQGGSGGTGIVIVRYPRAGKNLVPNSSFETDLDGWTSAYTSTISRSSEQAKVGSYSLKSVCVGVNDGCITTDITLSAYTAYKVSAWVYCLTPMRIQLDITDNIDNISAITQVDVPANAWTYLSASGTTDDTVLNVVYISSIGDPGTFYSDDVRLYAAPKWVPLEGGFPTLALVSPVSFTGVSAPGSTLTRVPAVWSRADTVVVEWLLNDVVVATDTNTYLVPNSPGAKVSIRETATGTGNTLVSQYDGTINSSMSGGSVYDIGGFRYHVFLASGQIDVAGSFNCEALVVGGGGGGGNQGGGGGGAGGVLEQSVAISSGTYAVTVGGGSAGAATKGGDSSIGSIISAIGGGAGGPDSGSGAAGGSGGGGSTFSAAGGAGTSGQGFAGGQARQPTDGDAMGGGGGGWKGAGPGNAGSGDAIPGGPGGPSVLLGELIAGGVSGLPSGGNVGGGGSPGRFTGGNPYYSVGGGGAGGGQGQNGTNGVANTGGGAGGGGWSNQGSSSGGSGIIVIRYPI
jgi:hypothetical protein